MADKSPVRVKEVVVLTTAMLTFISFWRAGAVVLCDLASTAYYIGGIVEQAVGKSAPWFILAVMLFSYAIRAVYIESCGMFVRGGVYKVVKEAMGSTLAKLSASALMFDYVLTGPISTVSAGQYLAGLFNSLFPHLHIGWRLEPDAFAVAFAVICTVYFWRVNIRGVPESSDKALKIMQLTTVMGAVMIVWCGYTLWLRGIHFPPFSVNLSPKALGWSTQFSWLRPVGAIGILMAFGHSLLAMSGEESLAQVYREIEAPKIKNLEKAGLLIFVYSLLLTSLTSFFAVMIIPDDARIARYGDNLLAGLAMSVAGPHALRMIFQLFVVLVGVLILAGAANTSIVGANGVFNRLAEDGVLLDWFRRLHHRYGTTYRIISLIAGMQIVTIWACRGDVYVLGEAYAFGVIWSFVFKTLAVMVLRFKDRSKREFMVPLNVRLGEVQLPVGLLLIFLVLLSAATVNLFTKQAATVAGTLFTIAFFLLFSFSEQMNAARAFAHKEGLEELNTRRESELDKAFSGIKKPNRILVALRHPRNLYPLRLVLEGLDDATDVVVIHSKIAQGYGLPEEMGGMGPEEEFLFSNVVSMAERYGHPVIPVLLLSNDPAYAVVQTAQAIKAQQIVMGRSERMSPETLLERVAMTWGSLPSASPQPALVRIVWDGKELTYQLG